jgi:3-hydroxybutyryl-CoA dehydrogenase
MGHGIAQVGAMAGFDVRLMDVDEIALSHAGDKIRSSLEKLERKRTIDTGQKDEVLARISFVTDLGDAVSAADVVIEAVPEVLELKREVFARIDAVATGQAILATNTSQYSVTSIGASTARPERVIGMHWFSPAVLMRLVEIVRGVETSDATVDRIVRFAEALGKVPVVCRRDSPGFITTRLIAVLTNEAQRIVEEGLASVEDVDRACRLAFGHPMGPFQTSDLTGLDTQLRVREALREAHGERFRPTNLLRTKVAAGQLGRKTGRGFYRYDAED